MRNILTLGHKSNLLFTKTRCKYGGEMYIIMGVVYIAFIMITMYLVVRDRKYPKSTKKIPVSSEVKRRAIIILFCTYFVYYLIGYLFKTDILNAITFRKDGASISFIGIALLLITYVLVEKIIDAIRKKIDKRKNH